MLTSWLSPFWAVCFLRTQQWFSNTFRISKTHLKSPPSYRRFWVIPFNILIFDWFKKHNFFNQQELQRENTDPIWTSFRARQSWKIGFIPIISSVTFKMSCSSCVVRKQDYYHFAIITQKCLCWNNLLFANFSRNILPPIFNVCKFANAQASLPPRTLEIWFFKFGNRHACIISFPI